MEPNSPKKIQFAVPLFHSHLDPQAAEHIRRRRPTPATLVIYNDAPAAEGDDKGTTGSQAEVQSAEPSPAQRKQSVYTPPTMKELQLVVEQHLQKQEHQEAGLSDSLDSLSPITAQHYGNAAQWANHNCPEPNGNEAFVSVQLGTEENPDSSCAGGRELTDPHGAREEGRDPRGPQRWRPHSDTCAEQQPGTPPRRKDTPYQHPHPFTPGGKLLHPQRESAFPEEEEGLEEQEDDGKP
ncbi:protein phosphatase 1 regulatory subunit 1C [Megalops cyprinoides]|uniref:protein phosphatase 1 regulatory subunit 1C n=1 Tax=Megalops cyprinoides TaxID=118141 RepID=UPI0018650345|nr:protein phosphatase 1 regulatory subunit 1C [Megalops cyprinoides]